MCARSRTRGIPDAGRFNVGGLRPAPSAMGWQTARAVSKRTRERASPRIHFTLAGNAQRPVMHVIVPFFDPAHSASDVHAFVQNDFTPLGSAHMRPVVPIGQSFAPLHSSPSSRFFRPRGHPRIAIVESTSTAIEARRASLFMGTGPFSPKRNEVGGASLILSASFWFGGAPLEIQVHESRQKLK
jgi:hypothetical protein